MRHILLALFLVCGCLPLSLCRADDAATDEKAAGIAALAEKLKANPDSQEALDAYCLAGFKAVRDVMEGKPDEAEAKLAAMRKTLDEVQPVGDGPKTQLARAKATVEAYAQQLELQRASLTDLQQKAEAAPDDLQAVGKFVNKLFMEASPLARTEPDKADALVKLGRESLTKIKEAATKDEAKKQVDQLLRQFTSLERSIEGGRKIAALIGTDSVPLDVEAWTNGTPLTDGDLKGKVVLLDFWAVWCGPCIATFPHLKEWNEKYGEKGLVIVGLTRYYNYQWDEAAGRAVGNKEGVPHEQEQEMLQKFAEHHGLHHRFAIQKKDGTLDKQYAVSGIPHVVLIDQQGKVRMIRVGSGEKNAKDLGDMIEKLLAAEPAK